MKAESDAGSAAIIEFTQRPPSSSRCARTERPQTDLTGPRHAPEDIAFSQTVLDWYHAHGRNNLPWQLERTPYRVWVSEIMLQQTQVSTVIPYFERFVARFPDVAALAQGHLDEVLALWAGLGYYARARNLHRAARIVTAQFAGCIPKTVAALSQLPGIGRSTAGAIVSLGHDQPAPILDGNVKRVLCRYQGIEGWPGTPPVNRELWSLSERLTPRHDTSRYNQAMMDLGATVCTPRNPNCTACPLSGGCLARISGRTEQLPAKKTGRRIPTRRSFALLLQSQQGHLYLERRPPTGIWGGLWCLPLIDQREEIECWAAGRGFLLSSVEELPPRRHTFTHFHLDYIPLLTRADQKTFGIGDPDQMLWHPLGKCCTLGLPAPIRVLLDDLGYFKPSE